MTLIARTIPALATAGSVTMLSTALFFQFILNYQPCELCIWQRWPHALVVIALIGWLWKATTLWLVAGSLTMMTGSGLAGYHWGVENHWWDGLMQCSQGLSVGELQQGIDWSATVSIVRCDEVAWSVLGMSMAGWNMVLSILLAIMWLLPLASYAKRGS